jgi:hypothetical protein
MSDVPLRITQPDDVDRERRSEPNTLRRSALWRWRRVHFSRRKYGSSSTRGQELVNVQADYESW